jgi:hypothetical protein
MGRGAEEIEGVRGELRARWARNRSRPRPRFEALGCYQFE